MGTIIENITYIKTSINRSSSRTSVVKFICKCFIVLFTLCEKCKHLYEHIQLHLTVSI